MILIDYQNKFFRGQNRDFFFENAAKKLFLPKLTYKYHYVYNIYIHNTPRYTFLIIKQKEKWMRKKEKTNKTITID